MDLTDKQMVKNFLDGDELAFNQLLKRYLKPVYNFLYRLTGDPSMLDDLAQVTFIKAWKNIRRFDRNKNFKAWIFTIAKNTAIDYFKKKKSIPFSFFTDEEGNNKLEEIGDGNILPDEILAKKDVSNEIGRKLKEISDQYRIILLMRYKDDLTLPEIAEILERPVNTVKSQHQRALVALRKTLLGK
jgi:RNA polymerase sigma-70 factor (ECF subfamily)